MTAMNKKEWSIVCTVQTWAVVVRKLDKTNKYIPIFLILVPLQNIRATTIADA
jgi:hypothetical protein